MQDQYFEFLEELGVDPEPAEWQLGPWEHEREWQKEFISQFHRPIAAMVVATSKVDRDWPPEKLAEVCDILSEKYGVQPCARGWRFTERSGRPSRRSRGSPGQSPTRYSEAD